MLSICEVCFNAAKSKCAIIIIHSKRSPRCSHYERVCDIEFKVDEKELEVFETTNI